MKELRLGKMSTQEIAEWMGIAYGTFRKKSAEKLKLLSYYADFEKVYGGVEIKEIYFKSFMKGYCNDDEALVEEVRNCKDGMIVLTGMANKFVAEREEYKDLSSETVRKRLGKAAMREFGNGSEPGLVGYRRRKWGIKLSEFNEVRLLTEEEMEIFKNLVNRYYKNEGERIIRRAELDDSLKKGFIGEELYWEEVNKDDFFPDIIRDFRNKTGKSLILATQCFLINELLP